MVQKSVVCAVVATAASTQNIYSMLDLEKCSMSHERVYKEQECSTLSAVTRGVCKVAVCSHPKCCCCLLLERE